ncbi:hypothetical protein SAMN05192553_10288 [Cyclobacterium xiamenense]|jgi:hypothetical protein|uniref:Uncharacterized protein n=1 Tax=Cyclobacterium xiamenense TaxID=1297121 RepID=A0A1H6VHY7_9BACT|nr:hypothetical protein [Cyclobacterium xiamenense]SEJ04218.1 hypothetical protein SAMN05192553_10288 [Cyclobacterium xiamenense]
MNELIGYAVALLLVLAHLVMASLFYRHINKNPRLSFHEKNDWRLKALVFPAYYWFRYKREQGSSS